MWQAVNSDSCIVNLEFNTRDFKLEASSIPDNAKWLIQATRHSVILTFRLTNIVFCIILKVALVY